MTVRNQPPRRKWWPFFFSLCLLPFLITTGRLFADALGPNPEEQLLHVSGEFFLRFLLLTLMATPCYRYFRLGGLMRYRRMLGLYAFFYGCLHLLSYLWFTQYFDVVEIWKDVSERRYILIGVVGWSIVLCLAITSTRRMMERLGPANWAALHRLVYLATLAGLLHYWMAVKADVSDPALYAGVFALLMIARLVPRSKRRRGVKQKGSGVA